MGARRLLPALVAGLVLVLAGGCATGPSGMPITVPGDRHLSRLACSASTLPGTTVHVVVAEMGMGGMMRGAILPGRRMMLSAFPAAVPAGQVSFVVENLGRRTHELVVLPLAPGGAAGQRISGSDGRVDETSSLGEASASCAAGSGDGIRSGSVGWVTLTLPAGHYELVCNRRHHYARGMHQAFLVTPR